MNQPQYMEDASYKVLDRFKKENETIAPLILALIAIILIVAFFAFKDCIGNLVSKRRSLSKECKNPPLLAQWKMRQIITKHTPDWSYGDRRRLFNAIWEAGANSTPGEIEELFNRVQKDAANDKFIQECLSL